jgi:HEAT repeat protein
MSDDFERDDEAVETLPTLEDALAELTSDSDNLPSPTVLYGLSGLSMTDMAKLRPVWAALDATYRRILMQMLVDASESNIELTYNLLGYENLNATEAEIRQAAIELLWEDESLPLMHQLIRITENDEHVLVRAEAAKALGRFVLLGEVGDLPETETHAAQEALLNILQHDSEALDVRRYALESIANCTRKEVVGLINKAYNSDDDEMRASAVVAMGRSCDARWENIILRELEDSAGDVHLESVRAAGELQLEEAVPHIIRLVADDNRDLLETIIWALGEIGGKQATRTLELLAERAEEERDEELIALIDDAIGNASLANGDFTLLDFSNLDDSDDE